MIQVNQIAFSYPISLKLKKQRPIVFCNLSLKFEENKIYGLLGKNGTGKTTMLNLLAGLNNVGHGSILIDGEQISQRNPITLGKFFLIQEEFELPGMSLDKFVKITRPFYPDFSEEILQKCLRDFEIEDLDDLSAMSMGTKKKVYISFALATNTKYLFMDEPTNGLDITSKSQFRKVLANNMNDNRTIIIATHQIHDVEQLLDHIIIFGDKGKLMDKSVAEITDKYSFQFRLSDKTEDVIYSEPSMQGNAVITDRKEGDDETQINLELLFNAVNSGKI